MANTTTPAKMNDGRMGLTIDSAKTLADTDCGLVQNVIKTATITLPATVVGYDFIIRNGGAADTGTPTGAGYDGTVTITVAPNALDKIAGNAFTATDNKAAINTLGNVGDEIQLVGDGVNGWMCTKVIGTWTRAA